MPAMRSFLRAVALIFAAFAAVGCGGSDADQVAFTNVTAEVFGSYSQGTYVLRSQEELSAAWRPFTQSGQDATVLPQFNFESAMVIGVSLGVGVRCYIPTVTEVVRSGRTMTVYWKSSWPDGPTTQACLHQWPLSDFVSVPQHQGEVYFVRLEG
ncbi:MAG: hypothetical protein C0453_00600 [Comamonadaceae bacterium]|nr:hypothetical protein [Comamonadaceae bacterium]